MADPIDWKARAAAVAALDGDAWDEADEAYTEAWEAAYRAEFIKAAVARPGWTEACAKEWLDAGHLPQDACTNHAGAGTDPAIIAAQDVLACEEEAANA